MKKLITLMVAFGLFACVSANAQSNATPAAKPQAATTVTSVEATPKEDNQTAKKDTKACKDKSASCCKGKSEANGKSCCKSKDKTEAKVEETK